MSLKYKNYLCEYEEKHLSDQPKSTDDIMYSNARALDLYGQGKRFTIEDNLIFYEVVKIVKEIIDRHYYNQQVQFSVNIANKAVVFTFIVDQNDSKNSYFIETMYMFITIQLMRQFGEFFKVSREEFETDDKLVLKVKVEINEPEKERNPNTGEKII